MPNPNVIAIPKDVWTKIAINVVQGVVHKLSTSPSSYLQTYRLTAEAAPANNDDAARMFQTDDQELISSTEGIDVYIQAVGAAGSIRVDL